MIKFWQRNPENCTKDEILSQKRNTSTRKTLKYRSPNNILFVNFSNDIILSPSGQAKIDNSNSCRSLLRSDFIIF
ncbi:MAG: hypothetical protein QNJ18_11060 [Xenococcaceae cyanobacterium MO_167.B52]|nr:hypothetical protein [Xenococcaceae cyanobacterium MO_167.B52]